MSGISTRNAERQLGPGVIDITPQERIEVEAPWGILANEEIRVPFNCMAYGIDG